MGFGGGVFASSSGQVRKLMDAEYDARKTMLKQLRDDPQRQLAVGEHLIEEVRASGFPMKECSLLVEVLGVSSLSKKVADEDLVAILMSGHRFMTDTQTVKQGLQTIEQTRRMQLLVGGVRSGQIGEYGLRIVCDLFEQIGAPNAIGPLVEIVFGEPAVARQAKDVVIAGVALTLNAGLKVGGFEEPSTNYDRVAELIVKL